jgi:beta-glucosidase
VKYFGIVLGLLFALSAAAADSTSIYHDGWIDLNKNGKEDVYENPSQPIDARVSDLLVQMTLEEEIGQLWQANMGDHSDRLLAGQLQRGAVSSFLGGTKLIENPVMRNKLQHIVIEKSRLGVPLIFGHDSIHGFRTVFPIPLAQSCAFDPELIEQTQRISARESAAAGIDWVFAPMVDLARDPRWGRVAEGFGEDPWLDSMDAMASVRGFQGDKIADTNQVVACLKHYVGYSAAEGGRDYNTTEISEYNLRNFYLPPFKAGVDAGAQTVMSAFNDLSGMPASANHHTLTEILRDDWKFPGFVVSDYNSVMELIDHGVAADKVEAARRALTAGVDMEMVSTSYVDTVEGQVKTGLIPKSIVDQAVRRVLTVKFKKGLFDNPYTDESRCDKAFLQPDAIALARRAGAECCVLLKNGKNILPLAKDVKRVALIGPLGDDATDVVGPWFSRAHSNDVVTLAAGIRAKLSPNATLNVVRGCAIIESGKARVTLETFSKITERPTGADEIAKAAAIAKNAEVIIMALGEPQNWSGEDASRSYLGLPGKQIDLFDAVVKTGKPVIVVLFNGRPLALPNVEEKAAAILDAWFPGIQCGNSVADVLFGDADPSARLTMTVPYDVGQVPITYNHFNTGRPGVGPYKGNYADGPDNPLYPFGYGLAYTTFQFGKVQMRPEISEPGGTITASAKIKNTGARTGTAVAQLYIRDVAANAGPRPIRELKGFQKIILQPGETKEVEFKITDRELGYYDNKGNWLVEPGIFRVWISKDSVSGTPAEFELRK